MGVPQLEFHAVFDKGQKDTHFTFFKVQQGLLKKSVSLQSGGGNDSHTGLHQNSLVKLAWAKPSALTNQEQQPLHVLSTKSILFTSLLIS